ncbi:phage tail tip fiber protein [Enterobacter hormaechei]|uniref:phage tail tip fiber protein n=1 Tax=Enterobacter hormaechei TaxID=158836 RepID=UPI002075E51E|nr:DUF1983 domain-containing protein [Enterobacter hormaechei]MCM7071428.1 DUF1983 domain-containing protein [Enterobacter hormaechei]MCM7088659.1 DUF1983 domain-containing protein [Enterobacter hormaechei]MCR4005108.1 DUF1983 domain-containing protein [Enterobacter hormaechei]MCR4052260.1 DUF1983 domain-containing protein [Enterobacter hormaechei]MEA3670177.1 DUF1983 domain-containing protein [Enterobacter hormaechei]
MKYLSLQQAMLGMRVIMTNDGLILKSPAGSAHYDPKGRRHTVKGNAEFFPIHLRVKDKRKPRLSSMSTSDKQINVYGDDGRLRVRIGQIPGEERVCIEDAKIGDAVLSTNYSVKMNVDFGGKRYAAGMSIGQPSEPQATVKFDRFKVHEAASSIIENAKAATKAKISLCEEMKQAIIDAVRESDLFAAPQAKIDAQSASVAGLQQAMHDAVNDAIRNALKPGGLLYKR